MAIISRSCMATGIGIAIDKTNKEILRKRKMYATCMKNGTAVRFRLGDIFCPDSRRVLEQITQNLEMTATVSQFCDGEGQNEFYAVLDVAGVQTPVIVPVHALRPVKNKATSLPTRREAPSGGD